MRVVSYGSAIVKPRILERSTLKANDAIIVAHAEIELREAWNTDARLSRPVTDQREIATNAGHGTIGRSDCAVREIECFFCRHVVHYTTNGSCCQAEMNRHGTEPYFGELVHTSTSSSGYPFSTNQFVRSCDSISRRFAGAFFGNPYFHPEGGSMRIVSV